VTNCSYRLAALSNTPLIHADRASPALAAAATYRAFLEADRRISSRSVSPLSSGGLPLGRFMWRIMPVQVFLDKWCG
jgi:hypothetical protein